VAAMNGRSTTVLAEVEQAIAVAGTDDNEYMVRGLDPDGGTERSWPLVTDRHLRLGERVFVDTGGTTDEADLVGVVDDERFAVAVIAAAIGAGFLTAGVRTHRWAVRCRRLEELVQHWHETAGR